MSEKKTNEAEPRVFEASELPVIQIPHEERPLLDLVAEVERVEKDIEIYNRIKILSLKLTKPKDWVIMGKSLYLQDRGAEQIAIAWGIHASIVGAPVMEWHEDKDGRYFVFTCYGKAMSRKLGRYVEEIGTCSQRDKFFGTVEGHYKQLEEVDVNMIKKKAVTNFYNRIIKRVAGLVSITEDDLKQAGLPVDQIPRVEFAEGGKKAERRLSPEYLKKREDIWKIALQLGGGKDSEAQVFLKQCSSFDGKDAKGNSKKFFVDNIQSLTSEKWIDATLERIKDHFKKAYPKEPLPINEGG